MHELPQPNPDGSYQLGPTGPLVIVGDREESRRIASAHQVWEMLGEGDESVVMSTFPSIPETVRFSISRKLTPPQGVKNILYTRAGEKRIMTMSGYLISDPHIEVVRDFTDKDLAIFSEELRAKIRLAQTIEMEHVQGFDAAVARHRERVSALEVTPVDMREAQRVYEAILYGH